MSVERWHQLRDLMSEISEDMYAAGWLAGLEYSLWALVLGEPDVCFSAEALVPGQLDDLRRLSAELGGWARWSDEPVTDARRSPCPTGPVFVPMAEWVDLYATQKRAAP
jgi:hypothetical protein